MKDYYKVLGVPRNATAAQIKQAYRNLVKVCHPDVNSSAKAAEWTRELNEAYDVLSNTQKKVIYDMDLKLQESKQPNTDAQQRTASQPRTEAKSTPRAEPNFCCENCKRVDSTLRMSVTWRVYSFINYSRKSPTVKILCNKCRVKESVAASIVTAIVGWWSIWGFFWTLEALFNNAGGGEQPKENNAALLNALGYQLYRVGRYQDAYEALVSAYKLQPDPKTEEGINFLKSKISPTQHRPLWQRFRKLELHPFYYHAPVGAFGLVFLIWGFNALNANSTASSSGQPASYTPRYQPSSYQQPQNQTPTWANTKPVEPVFAEPEQPLPEQGAMSFGADYFLDSSDTKAPFKITTPSDGNYVMKIEDWNTKKLVATYFIRRSSTLAIELPLGSYKLKFAQGEKWYGDKYLFGPRTTYSYVPDRMNFYIDGDYVRGHRIELIPQVNGNLETPPMRAQDW